MYDKLTSDVVTTIVGMAKGERPTINEVKSNHTEVTGTGISGSRIKILLQDGREYIGNVDGSGRYRITIPKQNEHTRIVATQITPRRAESDPVDTYVVRAVPAPVPTINEVDTDDTKVTGKGVANSKVYVKIPGKVNGEINVNSNGDWEVNTGLLNANLKITAYQILPERPDSEEAVRYVRQLEALPKPTIDEINSGQDKATGTATPGARLSINVEGVLEREIQIDSSGRWSVDIGYDKGGTKIHAKQIMVGRPWSETQTRIVTQLPGLRST